MEKRKSEKGKTGVKTELTKLRLSCCKKSANATNADKYGGL